MTAIGTAKAILRDTHRWAFMPWAAKRLWARDRLRGLPDDPGLEPALSAAVRWMKRAQDLSTTRDGGVARHFSVVDGWGPSYPETTGYIVPTMFEYGRLAGDDDAIERAFRMLDWLVGIQFPEGGFQGGTVDATPRVPVTFNTGQILIGLARGAEEKPALYTEPMHRAAQWLVTTQDADGCWRAHPTPFAAPGEKTYETHVAWGLMEAARVSGDRQYLEAALANVRWAISHQRANGWLARCCLSDPDRPLTHTLGYALRGILEAHRIQPDDALLEAARSLADGLMGASGPDGSIPGRLRSDWSPGARWICLTGCAQIAICWTMLFEVTDEPAYRDAAFRTNALVRRTMTVEGDPDIAGGVAGSFPISGDYGRYEYLNWACKFLIDALMREADLRCRERNGAASAADRHTGPMKC